LALWNVFIIHCNLSPSKFSAGANLEGWTLGSDRFSQS
jgi:hypothetical protein